MFRAASTHLATFAWSRALIGLLAFILIITLDGLAPAPAQAASLGRQVAKTRQSQVRVSERMREADRKLKKIRRQQQRDVRNRSSSAKRIDRGIKHREAARARIERAELRLEAAKLDFDRRTRVRPNPLGFQRTDAPRARKQLKKTRQHTRKVVRKAGKIERKATRTIRKHKKRLGRAGGYGARFETNVRKREAAEAVLGRRIRRMVALAQQKVARKTDVRPAQSGLKLPVKGYISQRFGCTRQRKGKRGPRCTRYHDGIDIAAPKGSKVRASANGVVAYVGFNPWDGQKRAFIVLVVHRGGLITNYAHLMPRRRVKAGQYVRRGKTIGFVGVTGITTGPHVHWEAIRGGSMRDPLSIN